jgi:hypothetical protein
MAEHTRGQPEHVDVSHEASDVDIRAIFQFAGGLVVLGIVSALIVGLLFGYLTRREDRASGQPNYPLAASQEERLPPEPRLQATPRQDLNDLRAAEDATLKSYQWVDRNAGVVRIPIDEAMKLTVQRGLPARPQTMDASK